MKPLSPRMKEAMTDALKRPHAQVFAQGVTLDALIQRGMAYTKENRHGGAHWVLLTAEGIREARHIVTVSMPDTETTEVAEVAEVVKPKPFSRYDIGRQVKAIAMVPGHTVRTDDGTVINVTEVRTGSNIVLHGLCGKAELPYGSYVTVIGHFNLDV